ncbi:MAG: hypothetical protein COB04_09720 [Gammaproteobacteria bacterium]|nr:MAG: hypothetical protein COB04_09720 [Gammaproteobacteria bacterium]
MKKITKYFQQITVLQLMLLVLVSLGSSHALSEEKYEFVDWESPVPTFLELGLDPKKIATIASGGQFVIVANPRDFTLWNARTKKPEQFKDKSVIYTATVIDAPADEIREMVWDMESQGKYLPLFKDTTNLRTEGNARIASYEQVIKVPILKLASDFIVQINKYDSGDIGMVLIDEGDVEAIFQYWEFYPLDDNRTLTVLTGWQDTDSASFMYKTILDAEPSFGRAFPVLMLYERLVQFRDEAARRHPEIAAKADDTIYDLYSVNTFVSEIEGLDVQELKKMAQLGGVQFYHKPKNLAFEDGIHEILQVSALVYVPLPKKLIQPLLNDFSSLPKYNDLTEEWLDPSMTEEDWGHLKIGVNIGPIHVPVHIYVVTEDVNDDRMLFRSAPKSYVHPVLGHVEYMKMDDPEDEGTVVEVTIGGVVGPDASFIFKLVRYVPFHNTLVASIYAMLTADSAGDWVTGKVADDIAKAKQKEMEKTDQSLSTL